MLRCFCRDKLSQALGPYSRLRARCFLLEIDLCLRKAQWHGEYACMHSTSAAEPLCLICLCFSNIRLFTRHLWHTRAHKLPDLTTSRDQKRKHFISPLAKFQEAKLTYNLDLLKKHEHSYIQFDWQESPKMPLQFRKFKLRWSGNT